MRYRIICLSIFLLFSPLGHAWTLCKSNEEIERKAVSASNEASALRYENQKLIGNLNACDIKAQSLEGLAQTLKSTIATREDLILNLQKSLEDKNNVARNMQYNHDGVQLSWIVYCDSHPWLARFLPNCQFSREQVQLAKDLLSQAIPQWPFWGFWRLLLGWGFIYLLALCGLTLIFRSVLDIVLKPHTPSLRYLLSKKYRDEIDLGYKKVIDEHEFKKEMLEKELQTLSQKSSRLQNLYDELDNKIDDFKRLYPQYQEKLESIKVKANNILNAKVEEILAAVSAEEGRRELIRKRLLE